MAKPIISPASPAFIIDSDPGPGEHVTVLVHPAVSVARLALALAEASLSIRHDSRRDCLVISAQMPAACPRVGP